jgi:hypothetical protein
MTTCIVCKAYLDSETVCPRCESDNSPWKKWQEKPIEKGGVLGLLSFTASHLHFPFVVTALSFFVGLVGTFMLWQNIKPGVLVLVLLMTPIGCLLALQTIYALRREIHQQELLHQVRSGRAKKLGVEWVLLLILAVSLGIVMFLMLALIEVDLFRELIGWMVLSNMPEIGPSIPERFQAMLPVTSLAAYLILSIAFTTISALVLALEYSNKLSMATPRPIFLQEALLVGIVQREAERLVCRSAVNLSDPDRDRGQEVRQWKWDEMERMPNGGVRLKAVVEKEDGGKGPASWEEDITYVVESDPWGLITKVARQNKELV